MSKLKESYNRFRNYFSVSKEKRNKNMTDRRARFNHLYSNRKFNAFPFSIEFDPKDIENNFPDIANKVVEPYENGQDIQKYISDIQEFYFREYIKRSYAEYTKVAKEMFLNFKDKISNLEKITISGSNDGNNVETTFHRK